MKSKVAGSIPDEVIKCFPPFPPRFQSTQRLTEMSTRNLAGSKERPARKADNLTSICESIIFKMWEL
jgi:hypothetical protein